MDSSNKTCRSGDIVEQYPKKIYNLAVFAVATLLSVATKTNFYIVEKLKEESTN